jgi:hypothetical protein
MPTPSRPGPTRDGARNLFLDADPTDDDALTEPNAPTSTHFAARRRSRGRIVAVDPCSPITAPPSHCARAARFTRPNAGIDRLRVVALARIRRTAVLAGRLLGRVAARPYAALTALGVLAMLLIALGWFGLEIRDASGARRVAEQRLTAATAALEHDRARIDFLSAQLYRAAVISRRQQETATAAKNPRPQAAERKPARGRRRRR